MSSLCNCSNLESFSAECGCGGGKTFNAPMTRYDEYCISCGSDCGPNTNLCIKCQKKLGVKKASNRMIARLGLGAESFEAMDCPRCDSMYCEGDCSEYWEGESPDDYVIVDRGNYRVRVHKKNLDKHGKETMSKIHNEANQKGLMYDEETGNYIPLNAESFEAEGCKHCDSEGNVRYGSKHDHIEPCAVCYPDETFESESKFDKLANKIAAEYRKKGKSAKEAMRIGKATAYKIGARKYGKAGMARKARAGMRAEEFHSEGKGGLPWMTFALIGLGAFVASRIKTVDFKAHDDCGCGCKGAGDCGDEKNADEGHYPETFDPVQDFLPRYRYPEDSDWSNSYNPSDPYRPLDYQTVQIDSRTTADRM